MAKVPKKPFTQKASILIVEDEAIAALSLEEMLVKRGYAVLATCYTAEDALELVKKDLPNIVLMDISLAGPMKGYDAAYILNEKYDLPVIFLTSYSQDNITELASKSGSFCYLLKPYNENQLLANIELTLAKHTVGQTYKELNQTKDRFFSIIAHDLRNPLAALSRTAQLLVSRYGTVPEKDIRFFLEEIARSSVDLYELTDNLLEWARIQTDKNLLNRTDFKPSVLIDFVVNLLRNTAKHKNVSIQNQVPENFNVFADLNMVSSVLNNLLTNAIKFSNIGGKIVVSGFEKDESITITVADEGIGIEPEFLEFIFDGSYKRQGTIEEKGTGLGLIISKQFVEQNKGQISVISTKGKGTQVSFTLPKSYF